MTLTSHFRTDAPVNPHRLHEFATSLVNPHGGVIRLIPQDNSKWGPKRNQLWNAPGQGLNALIWTTFGEDGPLRDEGWDVPYEGDSDDPDDGWEPAPTATVDVSMDSPYGFNLNGMGCSEYHAGLFLALNAYVLAEFPEANNYWYDEFNGDWNAFDDAEAWEAFAGEGGKAREWFNSIVPLIDNRLTAI